MIYTFGLYELDTQLYELRCAGESCQIEPKAFDLLIYLMTHRDRVVTREELFDQVWSDPFVSEAILSHHIMVARKAVGDNGRTQGVIKTIHGRGYRFIANVDVRDQPAPDVHVEQPPAHVEPVRQTTSLPVPDGETQDVIAGDYVLTTILCVTLDNVGTLSEQLGFEALQRLRQTFFTLAQDIVQRYDGTLQYFGADGVLSAFRSVSGAADHAQRAVAAALELQHHLPTPHREARPQPMISCPARMGLHSGPVDLESMTGDTINLAVWLQYQAQPGALLASAATMQLVQNRVSSTEPSAIRIPGHADPILAYHILGHEE